MKKSEVHLTQLASAAGCGAKIGPKVLAQVVGKLPKFTDPMLLVGPETSDDAAVYKINDELAMIHTVDFFPPVVDDPYMYGQIAAANALSDVYAMGGVPKLALYLQLHHRPLLLFRFLAELLRIVVETHAGLLLTVFLHLAQQDILLCGVELVAPVLLGAVTLAERQLQCVTGLALCDIVVGIDIEPIIIFIGQDSIPF